MTLNLSLVQIVLVWSHLFSTNHHSHSLFGSLIYWSVLSSSEMSIFMMINPPSLRHVAGTARPVRPPRWPWAGEATTPRWGPRPGRQTRTCPCWGRTRASTPPCLKDARHSSHRTSTNFPRLPPLPRHTNDKVAISNILPIRITWTLLSITSSQEISSFLSA